MAGGDGPHNFPSTISRCGETKRGTFAYQHYKYITKLSASLHRKNLATLKGSQIWNPSSFSYFFARIAIPILFLWNMAILLIEQTHSNIVEKKRDPKYLTQNAYTYHIHRISELPDYSVVFDWKV